MSRIVIERRRDILEIVQRDGTQSLAELAERLGVSTITIRRDVEALADDGLVRRRRGAVTSAGATPGPTRPAPGDVIGVMVPRSDYYFNGILVGANQAAVELGARLALSVSDYDSAAEHRLVDRLLLNGAHGLLLAPTPEGADGELSEEQQRWLAELPVPVVLVERPVAPGGAAAGLDGVFSAHEVGVGAAIRRFADDEHERAAFLTIQNMNTSRLRSAYERSIRACAMTSAGIAETSLESTARIRDDLLGFVADGATAVLVYNDHLAMRAVSWLADHGFRVPADVSLIGYDDVVAGLCDPALTAVAPQKAAVGYRAVSLVLTRLNERRGDGGRVAGLAARDRVPGGARELLGLVPSLTSRRSTAPRTPAPRTTVSPGAA